MSIIGFLLLEKAGAAKSSDVELNPVYSDIMFFLLLTEFLGTGEIKEVKYPATYLHFLMVFFFDWQGIPV